MNTIKKMQNAGLSKWLSGLLIALGVVLVVFFIFDAGMAVGMRRSMDMHGPRDMGREQLSQFGVGGFGVSMPHGFIPEGHGAVGTISSINASTITIQARDGSSEEIAFDTNTQIEDATSTLTQSDLKVGQQIVALGDPREATSSQQLKAVLIRILPPPPIIH